MLTLTTHQKMSLARAAQRLIMTGRGAVGLGAESAATRSGIRWHLDLNEGIDFAIWLLGAFEYSTVRTCQRLIAPGDVVVDIGANIGAHTLHLARAVGADGAVVAVEPTDFAFAKLSRNVAANHELSPRIRLIQAMLGAEDGGEPAPEIYSSWPLNVASDAHPLHHGQLQTCSGARRVTLDSLLGELGIPRVGLIKIDVDGFECDVFKGAQQVLERDRPKLVMELAPYVLRERGTSLAEMLALLNMDRYQLVDVGTDKVLPGDAATLERLIPTGGCRNVIAMPLV